MSELYFDVETTTLNKGHPFNPNNRLISYVTVSKQSNPSFSYHSDPDFKHRLYVDISMADELIGFNIKFDLHWACREGCVPRADQRVWDCQLAEFVISGQQNGFMSLNEALESYGLPTKPDQVAEYWKAGIDTSDIPIDILKEYNTYDVTSLVELKKIQMSVMTPEQINLVWLMGEDLKTLQHAEYNGILFDVDNATRMCVDLGNDIADIERKISAYIDLPDFVSFNYDSGDHLSALLYGGTISFPYATEEESCYKSGPNKGMAYTKRRWHIYEKEFVQRFQPLEGTEVKKCLAEDYKGTIFFQVDAPTLKQLKSRKAEDRELLRLLGSRSEKIKVAEMVTSIMNKMKEMNWENNYIHGQFNQNIVITGRLSSSGPNLQNTPPEVDQLLISRYVD